MLAALAAPEPLSKGPSDPWGAPALGAARRAGDAAPAALHYRALRRASQPTAARPPSISA